MFDPVTAKLLRSAPKISGVDPENLPQIFTDHYAQIVSFRLGGEADADLSTNNQLEKIADTYELIAAKNTSNKVIRPSAFVAASARQLIARRELLTDSPYQRLINVDRNQVSASLSAILLFLASEQYADAAEATALVNLESTEDSSISNQITQYIVALGRGNLGDILNRKEEGTELDFNGIDSDIESTALNLILNSIAQTLELIADALSNGVNDESDNDIESKLNELISITVSNEYTEKIGNLEICYSGPHHLVSLIKIAYQNLKRLALSNLQPPDKSDSDFWKKWIKFRSSKFPYVWPNHKEAIDQKFHHSGISAITVLPTGAGKTTVSSLKIATTLSQREKVIFLAPTNALVEQLTRDLQEMFPQDLLGSLVSSESDFINIDDPYFNEIEVMTPERCLAVLSYSPESFVETGLLVFDECHLLSSDQGSLRRSIDAMLCLLSFVKLKPDADMLFLSAMIKNGEEFAKWIQQLTNKKCLSIDLLWKPSRQARGVVIYEESEKNNAINNAIKKQQELNESSGGDAKDLRAGAQKKLLVSPYALWGLQHNWLDKKNNKIKCAVTKIIQSPVLLNGKLKSTSIELKPNANAVSARIAASCAENNIKTIVFVNQKTHTISTCKAISEIVKTKINTSETEEQLWDALHTELGDLKHSAITRGSIAVPHNASMLHLERLLSEEIYLRKDGAKVIVATPTLAQGLNLPAQVALISSDKRSGIQPGKRDKLKAHELLNSAGRAGRAGHLANGVVLLIPEPVIYIDFDKSIKHGVVEKLESVLPEDDRCLDIIDPVQQILDKISHENFDDKDVLYLVNRLSAESDTESDAKFFNLGNSLAVFNANQNGSLETVTDQLEELSKLVAENVDNISDPSVLNLSSQTGLPIKVIQVLKERIVQNIGYLPTTIIDWVRWLIDWLSEDEDSRNSLLSDIKSSINGSAGRTKTDSLNEFVLQEILPGINSWIRGKPINEIEKSLNGTPDSSSISKQRCPRARDLISTVIPRGVSFIMLFISKIINEVDPYEKQPNLTKELIEALSPAIRLGYDTPDKLKFAYKNKHLNSRVLIHKNYLND